jgi:hypothetical protein
MFSIATWHTAWLAALQLPCRDETSSHDFKIDCLRLT